MGFDLKPLTIICDFEQAFMNAVTNEVYVSVFLTASCFKVCSIVFIKSSYHKLLLPVAGSTFVSLVIGTFRSSV